MDPQEHPILSRRRAPVFRPTFTLALLYLAGFFAVFVFLLVLPELLTVLRDVPPGPEQERVAREMVQAVAAPRLPWAVALAVAAVGLGSYLKVLPGLRRP